GPPAPAPAVAEVPAADADAAPARPEARAWGESLLEEVRESVDRRSRSAVGALAGLLERTMSRGLYLGLLRPGDRIPGIREVARATGLNHKTVARAYRELEARGVLEVRDRSGVYAAPQGWTDRRPPAGAASWAAEVMTEAWRRRIAVPELPGLLRRWTAAAPLRCAVVESDAARREALCAEVGEGFGLDCVPLAPDLAAAALAGVDLVVTTSFHAAALRALVRGPGKPLVVATARPHDGATAARWGGSDAAPLPGLCDDTARTLAETLVVLNLERPAESSQPEVPLPG
ncbi:MAG TPA: GntR family transcriptional regulator, partial [Longimicrobiaceae bacterium]|nr:GntR family transcriptional regulator [Longimicrobiaceae bacterium]